MIKDWQRKEVKTNSAEEFASEDQEAKLVKMQLKEQ